MTDALTNSKTANYVYAAPNGSAGSPSFRKLVAADIPSLAASKITSGTLSVARGGTGQTSVDTTPTSGSSKMCTSGGIYTAINSLKTSVSEGKALVAAAVTDKGVNTAADATFQTIATNIGSIQAKKVAVGDCRYGENVNLGWQPDYVLCYRTYSEVSSKANGCCRASFVSKDQGTLFSFGGEEMNPSSGYPSKMVIISSTGFSTASHSSGTLYWGSILTIHYVAMQV